jgi:type I restriction enzyme R subunit
LIEHAKQLQDEDHRTKELGLTDEELAFYDILASKKDIIKENGPIQDIMGVVKAVKSSHRLIG